MSIKEKQNEHEILKLQYAARHVYNSAELLGLFSWLLTFAIILIGWFDNGANPDIIAYIVAIITIINSAIDYLRNKAIKIASGIRTYIDYTLFDINSKKVYNGLTIDIINKFGDVISKLHKKTYLKQISHSGTDAYKGVKDWYTLNDEMTTEEEILSAQKENCGFDKSISRDSIIISVILFAVFAFCIIKLDQKFLLICAFLPAGFKIIKSLIDYYEYKKIYDEERILVSKLDDYGYNEKLSIQLQECINNRRQLSFVTFSFVHKLKSNYIHYKLKKINEHVNK